ncbi:hypothetical protein, partial [Daejeonella rubra]|uniref:hypothetical protein n=1 Tax=Daejeonella rubra TaxID=990371 RepID=UPI001C8822FB
INYPADSKLQIKLFKTIEAEPQVLVRVSRRKSRGRNIAKYRWDRAGFDWDWCTAETVRSHYPRS